LVQRFGSRKTIIMALTFSSMGILATLSSQLWVIVIGLAVLSTGVFITQSSTIGFVTSRISEGRSLATGLYNMSYYFGGTLGATVCGITFIWGGWNATAMALFIAQLSSMSIAFVFMKTKNPDLVR
jgi:predicted MFS family arabinose efflux permease